MPFKSQAQKLKFQQLLAQGKITQGEYNEWDKATPTNDKLPARIGKKGSQRKPGSTRGRR